MKRPEKKKEFEIANKPDDIDDWGSWEREVFGREGWNDACKKWEKYHKQEMDKLKKKFGKKLAKTFDYIPSKRPWNGE